MARFSREQEASIERKVRLFSTILEKGLSKEELERRLELIEQIIIEKRLKWYEKNKRQLAYLRKRGISDLQRAVGLLYAYHMKVFEGITVVPFLDIEQGIFSVDIQARNFCPYLEAFKRMRIKPEDSVRLCQQVLERPCQVIVGKVNPNIRFFRDYGHVRPLADYCDETMIIRASKDSSYEKILYLAYPRLKHLSA